MSGTNKSNNTLLGVLDNGHLTARYYMVFVVVTLIAIVEFFDFFQIAYVVSMVAGPWHLTYGESAVVLMAAGVGAILGSLVVGRLSDRFGRKPTLIASVLLFSCGTGAMTFVPDGLWIWIAILRCVVGAGVGGAVVAGLPLLIEVTPTRHRTKMGSFSQVGVPLGTLLASGLAAWAGEAIGWRGIVAVGVAPAVLAICVGIIVPESPRWLLSKGRVAEARQAVAKISDRPVNTLPAETGLVADSSKPKLRDLQRNKLALVVVLFGWLGATITEYGVALWSPTILKFTLHTTPAHAAYLMVFVSLGGMFGRLLLTYLAQRIGRRITQVIASSAGAVLLLLTAVFHSVILGSVSLFWLISIAAFVFLDGTFANMGPYTPEVFPTRLRGLAMGVAEAVNGIGKIIGPLAMAAIAGTSDIISPTATAQAVFPGYVFFAVATFIVAAVFFFARLEPHGKKLDEISQGPSASRPLEAQQFAPLDGS